MKVVFQHQSDPDTHWGPYDMNQVPTRDDVVHLGGQTWRVSNAHFYPETNRAVVTVGAYP